MLFVQNYALSLLMTTSIYHIVTALWFPFLFFYIFIVLHLQICDLKHFLLTIIQYACRSLALFLIGAPNSNTFLSIKTKKRRSKFLFVHFQNHFVLSQFVDLRPSVCVSVYLFLCFHSFLSNLV